MTSPKHSGKNLILAINSGSSSLKLGFFRETEGDQQLVLTGTAEGIGRPEGSLDLRDANNQVLLHSDHLLETQADALAKLVEASRKHLGQDPAVIGHRIVHGGPELTEHQPITPSLLDTLRAAVHFAPLHIPEALTLIEAASKLFPAVPSIACFDTAFHRNLPEVARHFPLPDDLNRRGIHRYGFHGLSYESIVHRLGDHPPARAVLAHLGNGSSLCALRSGASVDTTMGLTPTGGVPMATRSGDLDPGVLLFLMRSEGMDADALETLLNHGSGLAALSGGESDMRALLARQAQGDATADLAVSVFTTAVRKTIGAYAALLGGIDLLVFTGGIGEHSSDVRSGICKGLEFLGLGPNASPSRVLVMPSEEERQIARICCTLTSRRSESK